MPRGPEALRRALAAAGVALAGAVCASGVQAHPHFRFSYQVEPIVESATVTGLRVTWWVDADASAQIRQSADLDRNGRLDADELAAFARGNEGLLRPQGFFLRADTEPAAGQPQALGLQISGALAADDDGAAGIRLRFSMRFFEPPPAAFSVRFFDPTWNVVLTPHTASTPVASGAACRADAAQQTLSTLGWGDQAVTRVVFRCEPAQPARLQALGSSSRRADTQERKQ